MQRIYFVQLIEVAYSDDEDGGIVKAHVFLSQSRAIKYAIRLRRQWHESEYQVLVTSAKDSDLMYFSGSGLRWGRLFAELH